MDLAVSRVTDATRRKAAPKPLVTFTAEPWVWLEVWGAKTADYGWREDGGLTSDLMAWMLKEKIDWRSQRSGGGAWVGRIPVGDASRVLAWLEKQGAQPSRKGSGR